MSDFPQQDPTAVGRDLTIVDPAHHLPSVQAVKIRFLLVHSRFIGSRSFLDYKLRIVQNVANFCDEKCGIGN